MSASSSPAPTVELLIQAGIAALRVGDRARSRELLKQALQLDPNAVQAWLWLSGSVDTDASRRRCLRKVLEIDPQHAAARRGLAQLGVTLRPLPQPIQPAQPSTPSTTQHTQPADQSRWRLRHWLRRPTSLTLDSTT